MTRKTVEAHVRSLLAKPDLPVGTSENRLDHAALAFLQADGRREDARFIDACDGRRP